MKIAQTGAICVGGQPKYKPCESELESVVVLQAHFFPLTDVLFDNILYVFDFFYFQNICRKMCQQWAVAAKSAGETENWQ